MRLGVVVKKYGLALSMESFLINNVHRAIQYSTAYYKALYEKKKKVAYVKMTISVSIDILFKYSLLWKCQQIWRNIAIRITDHWDAALFDFLLIITYLKTTQQNLVNEVHYFQKNSTYFFWYIKKV